MPSRSKARTVGAPGWPSSVIREYVDVDLPRPHSYSTTLHPRSSLECAEPTERRECPVLDIESSGIGGNITCRETLGPCNTGRVTLELGQ